MLALILLELAFVRNNVLAVLRSPSRLALWGGYALALIVAGTLRVHSSITGQAASSLSPALASALGGGYLAMLGGSIVYYALGNVVAFRSRAEALLFANVGLPSRTVAIWLQIRKLLSTLTRWLWTILLNFVIFLPAHARSSELVRGFLASIVAAMLLMTLEIPTFLLGRKKFGLLLIVAGGISTVFGLAYVLLGLGAAVGNEVTTAILATLPIDPGIALFALLDGPTGWLIAFASLPILVSISMMALGQDVLPELYGASVRWFTTVERSRSVTSGAVFLNDRRGRPRGWVPTGSLVLIWKDWLAFKRRRGGMVMWLLLVLTSTCIGIAMAVLAGQAHRESAGWSLLSVMSAFVYFVPLFASVGLADDVGKPLFWMATHSLHTSLCSWTIARSWRGAVVIVAAPVVAGIGMGDYKAALISIPLTFILWFSLNAMGVLIYALFPSGFDARGPLFFLRLIAAFVLILPGVITLMASVSATRNLYIAIAVASTVLAFEAIACLGLAAARLCHNGAGIALLERSS